MHLKCSKPEFVPHRYQRGGGHWIFDPCLDCRIEMNELHLMPKKETPEQKLMRTLKPRLESMTDAQLERFIQDVDAIARKYANQKEQED